MKCTLQVHCVCMYAVYCSCNGSQVRYSGYWPLCDWYKEYNFHLNFVLDINQLVLSVNNFHFK